MAQNKFKGLGIALITPFKADGTIDWKPWSGWWNTS